MIRRRAFQLFHFAHFFRYLGYGIWKKKNVSSSSSSLFVINVWDVCEVYWMSSERPLRIYEVYTILHLFLVLAPPFLPFILIFGSCYLFFIFLVHSFRSFCKQASSAADNNHLPLRVWMWIFFSHVYLSFFFLFWFLFWKREREKKKEVHS